MQNFSRLARGGQLWSISFLLGDLKMPIRAVIRDESAFTPEETELLVLAYEDTLRHVGEPGQNAVLELFVARQIIDAASGGERDPEKLRDSVLAILSALGPGKDRQS